MKNPVAAAQSALKDAKFILEVLALGARAPEPDDVRAALYNVDAAIRHLSKIAPAEPVLPAEVWPTSGSA